MNTIKDIKQLGYSDGYIGSPRPPKMTHYESHYYWEGYRQGYFDAYGVYPDTPA